MLSIIAGRTGRLWAPMVERLRAAYGAGHDCLVIVPEQYTLQAEKDLLKDLGVPGFFRLEVLSPTRLAQRVKDRLGSDPRTPIDERGRNMAVARALVLSAGKLVYYGSAVSRQGFAEKLAPLISAFKEAGVSPGALGEKAEKADNPTLRDKLSDISIVYEAYEALLQKKFADREDLLSDMMERITTSRHFAETVVFVYGFDTVTETLSRLIACLSAQALGVHAAFVAEHEREEDGEAFARIRQGLERLREAAARAGSTCSLEWLSPARLEAAEEIAHLESYLLAVNAPPYAGDTGALRLYAAQTPHAEVLHAAYLVSDAIRQGIPPSEIAVLCGSLGTYAELIADIFSRFGIPFYVSDKTPVASHTVVRCLLAALRCASDGWRREDVLGMVKSGFSPLDEEEGFVLENYALKYGISAGRWTAPFSRGEAAEVAEAEALRLKLTAPVLAMQKRLAAARTPGDSLRAVIAFLEEIDAYNRIIRLEEELLAAGMSVEAARTRQVWGRLVGLFEQMFELMDDKRIPTRYFAQWLSAGLSGDEIASLPPEANCVQCGAVGQLKVPSPRIALVLGLNDGMLGGPPEELLTDREVEAAENLFAVRMEVSLKAREEAALLDLWKALSSPRERLVLSWSVASEEGGVLRPLSWLERIRHLFPALEVEGGASAGPEDSASFPAAPLPALDAVAPMLRDGTLHGPWRDAWAWLCADAGTRPLAEALVSAARGETISPSVGRDLAASLFDTKTMSVSRLETYARCPFMHFVEHGLRPQRRREWMVEPVDAGTFYHEALAGFTKALAGISAWPHITQAQSDAVMDAVLKPLTQDWERQPFADTARAKASSGRYLKVLKSVAWNLTCAAKLSSFRPDGQEARFGIPGGMPPVVLGVPGAAPVALRGAIDRIDRYEGEAGSCLRVVDYKSSARSLDAAGVWWGLELQLLIYLKAAIDAAPGTRPAGAFYQVLANPLAKTDDPDRAAREITQTLRLSGIAVDDPHILKLMDASGGTYMKNRPLCPPEGVDLLLAHAVRVATAIAARIHRGLIPPSPVLSRDGRRPCDYCDYAGICRRDPLLRAGEDRILPAMTLEELLALCAGGVEPVFGFGPVP